MKLNINFPENLYSDIRIEEVYKIWYTNEKHDVTNDGDLTSTGAMIRVYDGRMWYTASTNSIDEIQKELDDLACIATPNPDIYDDPVIKKLEVNTDSVFLYNSDNDFSKVTRKDLAALVDHYIEACTGDLSEDINYWCVHAGAQKYKKTIISSKGSCLEFDYQHCNLSVSYAITWNGVTTYAYKGDVKFNLRDLYGLEKDVLEIRDRYIDYAHNAVDIEPGDYPTVLAPVVTAMFTHESFGHKSESDFMLNDETLRAEWVMGKTVGSPLVTIVDRGDIVNHGYTPYDDECTRAKVNYLITKGVLTGRLHDSKSAVALDEELTGNCRAQDFSNFPVVRMTNTYMENGESDPEELIKGIKDGIYVYDVSYGTGQAKFTMKPTLSYRIRDGKLCEPVRANVINGSVFETLFDIDGVGNDFKLFDTFSCGKMGQGVNVSAGGPSIRVRKLTFN